MNFFLMDGLFIYLLRFFKVSIEFVTLLFLFYVFGHEACGVLAP